MTASSAACLLFCGRPYRFSGLRPQFGIVRLFSAGGCKADGGFFLPLRRPAA